MSLFKPLVNYFFLGLDNEHSSLVTSPTMFLYSLNDAIIQLKKNTKHKADILGRCYRY